MAERVIDTLITVFGFRTDRAQLDAARRNIESVRRGLDTFARGVGIAGAAAGAGLAAVGRASLEFERSQNRIAAVYLEQSRESLAPLREQARELGATTSRTATEAANAQVELARAGFELNETLAATPHVLDLAIAGELEMSEAALLLSSQLNAFGLEATEAARVTDVLAAVASSAATSVGQLGPALRQVAPLAAAAGMSLEEVGAALGLLRDTGLRAEAAGTALRGILARLSDPAPPTSFTYGLRELGLTAAEVRSALEVDGLAGVMRLMRARGLDAADAIQIFGVEAASAAASLAARAEDLVVFERRLGDVDGTAERMRERMAEGLPGATASFTSALQELMLALGDAGVTGQLLGLLGVGTRFLRWLAELPGPIRTVAGGLVTVTVALFALGIAARAASFALAPLPLRFAALAAKTALVTVATWAFNTALFANPITWIILGVVALTAALVVLALNFDRLRGAWTRSFADALAAMRAVWDWASTHWPLLAATLGGPFTLIPYLLWRFRDTIEETLTGLWDWITGLFERMFGWVDDLIGRVQSFVPFWGGGENETATAPDLAAILPSAPALSSAVSGMGVNGARHVEASIQLDNINIAVEHGDPDEIAAQVGRSLQTQLQDAAEDFGGRIVR